MVVEGSGAVVDSVEVIEGARDSVDRDVVVVMVAQSVDVMDFVVIV